MNDAAPLRGRRILVTGAAGGIGLEAVRELAALGAHVIVAARDATRADAVARAFGPDATGVALDVADPASIRAAVALLRSRYDRLDVLVNNAGVLLDKRELAPGGLERTWATNVLGPFSLTNELLPLLNASGEARVVMVGSVAQRYCRAIRWDDSQFANRRYSGGAAYAHSKLALLYLTRAYARHAPRLASSCVHPGAIGTGIFRRMPWPVDPLLRRFLPPAAAGAKPVVRLAADPACAALRGAYFDRATQENPPQKVPLDQAFEERLWLLLESQAAAR